MTVKKINLTPPVVAGIIANPTPGQGEYCCGSCGSVDIFMWDAKGRHFPYKGQYVELTVNMEVLSCAEEDCASVNILPDEVENLDKALKDAAA